jgi:hypothetical protein
VRLRLELEAVHADVHHSRDADQPLRIGAGTSGDAGDKRVPGRKPLHLRPRLRRHAGGSRALDDRRERAVDVEEDRSPLRVRGEVGKQAVAQALIG